VIDRWQRRETDLDQAADELLHVLIE